MDLIKMAEIIEDKMVHEYQFCVNGGIYDDGMARKAFILDLIMLFSEERQITGCTPNKTEDAYNRISAAFTSLVKSGNRPSYEKIAKYAKCSKSTVAKFLKEIGGENGKRT
jgi:hypothetical protein